MAAVTIRILGREITATLTAQSIAIPIVVCPNRVRCDGYWSFIQTETAAHRSRQVATASARRVRRSTVKLRLHAT